MVVGASDEILEISGKWVDDNESWDNLYFKGLSLKDI